MGSRTTARRLAMQAIYQSEVSHIDVYEALNALFEEETLIDESKEFSKKLVLGVIGKKEELDIKIAELSKNWAINRISQVDKSILMLALYELYYEKETPRPVVINEALELAKKYSDENSARFINGILGAAVV